MRKITKLIIGSSLLIASVSVSAFSFGSNDNSRGDSWGNNTPWNWGSGNNSWNNGPWNDGPWNSGNNWGGNNTPWNWGNNNNRNRYYRGGNPYGQGYGNPYGGGYGNPYGGGYGNPYGGGYGNPYGGGYGNPYGAPQYPQQQDASDVPIEVEIRQVPAQ